MSTPNNLYEYYTSQGKSLPGTAGERFSDPTFAAAAKRAGYDANSYSVNAGNSTANQAILQQLISGGTTTGGAGTGTGTGTPPPDSAAGIASGYQLTLSPEEIASKKATEDWLKLYGDQASTNVDPNEIYKQKLNESQASIDALNNLYADKLNAARAEGAGRLGSTTAINARSGMAGSDFGAAATDRVKEANLSEEDSIRNEQNAAIQSVLSGVRNAAASDLAAKTEAKRQGADALLTYYENRPAAKAAALKPIIATLLSKGLDPNTMSPSDIKTITDGLGVSKDDIFSVFREQKTAQEKAKADAALTERKSLPPSVQEYEYAVQHGYGGTYSQYQNEDANRKALAIRQPAQQTEWAAKNEANSSIVSVLSSNPTVKGTDIPTLDINGFLTPEGFKSLLSYALSNNISRKEFLADHGDKIYADNLKAYGIKESELQ